VAFALGRLDIAEKRAALFRDKIIPDLRKSLDNLERQFEGGLAGADLTRLIDVRRKLLRARDGQLDALWAVRQARADLLAAIGEPVLGLCAPPPAP
jgi:outer membrane protein TolC